MLEPSKAYHGVKFYETFGDFGYTMKARMEVNRTFGASLSPLNAWLILQGIETLHLRMQEHCRNALARWRSSCSDHPLVSWVNYPGLQRIRHTTRWPKKRHLPARLPAPGHRLHPRCG
jgi:O-acetylhomoserine (thiol)-lyase